MAKMPNCQSQPYHIGFVGHSLSWSLGVTVILLLCIAQQGLGSIHACVFFFFFLFILIINNNRHSGACPVLVHCLRLFPVIVRRTVHPGILVDKNSGRKCQWTRTGKCSNLHSPTLSGQTPLVRWTPARHEWTPVIVQ